MREYLFQKFSHYIDSFIMRWKITDGKDMNFTGFPYVFKANITDGKDINFTGLPYVFNANN